MRKQLISFMELGSVLSATLILWGGLCFTNSDYIYFYVTFLGVVVLFMVARHLALGFNSTLNAYIVWTILFNFLLGIYGVFSDYGGYSPAYHALIFISAICFFYLFYDNSSHLMKYVTDVVSLSTVVIGIYLLIGEWSTLSEKIILIIAKQSWYRFGDGLEINPNAIAIMFSIFAIFTFYSMFRNKASKILLLVFIFQVAIILLSGSKKGIVVIGLIFGFAFFNGKNTKDKLKYALLGLILLLLLTIVVTQVDFFYNLIGYRINDMLGMLGLVDTYDFSNSTDLRADMIKEGLYIFPENPIFGHGWNYFSANAGFAGLYSHNTYIEILVSMGLFGLFTYYSLHLYLLFKSICALKNTFNKFNIFLLLILFFLDSAAVNMYGSIAPYFILSFISVSLLEKNKYFEEKI